MAASDPLASADPRSPPPPGSTGFKTALATVSVVTASLILIAGFSYYTYQKTFADNTLRVEAVSIILRETTAGHLAFEEILSGDTEAKLDSVWPHWDLAESTANSLLSGGEIVLGMIPAFTDTTYRASVETVLAKIGEFRGMIPTRYTLLVAQEGAVKIDLEMDAIFADIITDSARLGAKLHSESRRSMSLAKTINLSLVFFYLLLAGGLILVFIRYEKNRARATRLLLKRESQLRQAQKMETIGNLAGGIAHDFNNLLQTIIGYGEILAVDLANSDQGTEEIDYILHAGHRASDLTGQLLAFSRRQMISPTDIDLNELITSLMKMLQRLIGENINLETVLAPDPVIINADRTQVEQILMNLCLNSRDAITGSGTVTIAVECREIGSNYRVEHSWAAPGMYALLTVNDDGAGMSQEVIDLVFEPFFTTKEVGKGTGLGLATVYGIIKQNRGMVSIYSELGRGTTIKIYWPLGGPTPTPLSVSKAKVVAGGNETILIAEDDASVRDFVIRVLSEAGYKVLIARDGQEAIDLFRTTDKTIDLVLLDVVMPHFGGREVMDHIRRSGSRVPIMFCSGYSTNSVHTDFVVHDDIVLLEKPYRRNELLEQIHKTLHGEDQL